MYAVLGTLAALGAVSLGWLLLAPVLVIAGVLRFATRRRGAIGMAVGAGAMLLLIGVPTLDRAYGARFVVMGGSLLVAGFAEQARRTWAAPR
jgi:hypothetical protein